MGRVETFDHTADLGRRVHASDLPDLFQTAAEGLFDVIVANRDHVAETLCERVILRADSPEELLLDWLNELIFRAETGHRLFRRFEVSLDAAGQRLEAILYGESINPDRHILDHEVKAVTHHAARLEQSNGGWVAELILDI